MLLLSHCFSAMATGGIMIELLSFAETRIVTGGGGGGSGGGVVVEERKLER